MTSFEVCPSKVRITRRLSYTELDDMLAREETNGRILVSLLTDGTATPTSTAAAVSDKLGADGSVISNLSPSPSQSPSEGRIARSNLGKIDLRHFISFLLISLFLFVSSAHFDFILIFVTSSSFFFHGAFLPSPPPSSSYLLDSFMKADLSRLNYWATVRHACRNKKNALDQYLRHKTELSLSVRTDQKTNKYVVSGFTTWSNATSMSLVSEYMILMCQTVGSMCQGIAAPVLYKTQSPQPVLTGQSVKL